MKNRILTFIIGILVGSIITTLGFLVYIKSQKTIMPQFNRMPMNENNEMQPPRNMNEPHTTNNPSFIG